MPLGSITGSFPDDLDPHNVPAELKKEGSDWFAIFNPKVKRVLDVSLVHTLMHERYVPHGMKGFQWANAPARCSVVCCVRFSADGKFLATGCNRTAQIYDTKTGLKTWYVTIPPLLLFSDCYSRSSSAYSSTSQQGRLEISTSVVCVSALTANTSPQVPRINKYEYVIPSPIISSIKTILISSSPRRSFFLDLGHCQKAYPQRIRRAPARNLLSRFFHRRASHRLRVGRQNC